MKVWIALGLLAVLGGCTDDSKEFVTPPQDDEGRYVIEMNNQLEFDPKYAEVPVGSTVVFVVAGATPHDTRAEDGTWRSATLREGEEYEVELTAPGEHKYVCTLHLSNDMRGVLRVVE